MCTTTATPPNVPLPTSGTEAARPAAGATELGSQMQHQLDILSRANLSEILGAAGDGPSFQELVLKAYPHISLLRDAKTYEGKEVERTVKSMLNLCRFVNADYDSLGGANKEALMPGLTKLRELIISGCSNSAPTIAALDKTLRQLLAMTGLWPYSRFTTWRNQRWLQKQQRKSLAALTTIWR